MITTLLATFALSPVQMPIEALDAWAGPAGLKVLRSRLTEGDVVVYLPARMAAGDQISGSVYLEPSGESMSQQAANAEALKAHSLDAMGTTLMLADPQFTLRLPDDGSPLVLTLRHSDGGTASRMTAEVASLSGSDEPAATPVVEEGTAIRVVGSFDGNRENTVATLDGVAAGVIAEGSRDCVVSTMNLGPGSHRLKVRENGVESEHMVNIVRVTVKPPLDARVGRKTAIEVAVDGLEGVDASAFPLRLVLSNSMPKVFPFGESATLDVHPNAIVQGRWSQKLEFKPKKKGEFSMVARLECDGYLRRIGQ